jgi:N-acetyltransferase 10
MDSDNVKTDEAAQFKVREVKMDDKIKPRKHLEPILQKLSERKPSKLDYIGTSFGVTKELYNFWRKNKFEPIYLRQAKNDLTGEHSCVMIRSNGFQDWL